MWNPTITRFTTATITLHCWVHGGDPSVTFSVKVASTRTVEDLKAVIKEKRPLTFQHVDADTLLLWKVSLDLDVNLPSNLRNLVLVGEPLSSWTKLSSVFSDQPTADCLHVVIQHYTLDSHRRLDPDPHEVIQLNCLILGEPPSRFFDVEIASKETVYNLKDVIKKRREITFQHVDAAHLDLWQVSIPTNQTVSGPLRLRQLVNNVPPLGPARKVFEVFSESPALGHIHIIVTSPTLDDVGTLRVQFLKETPAKSPSSGGKTKQFLKRQADSDQRIYCNRPRDASTTIPVTLLHPIFGQFIDDCENNKPTAQDNALVLELSEAMSDFYQNEDDRARNIREIFAKYDIHLVRTEIEGTRFETDGDISHEEFRYALAEIKNDFGSSGADPFAQAILYYLESTRKQAPVMLGSVLPCMIVVIIGPHMGFAGAAWNDRPVIQVLSTTLPFHFHDSDTNLRTVAARHLGAFKKAIRALERYYRSELAVSQASHQPSSHGRIFPYQTDFTSLADLKTHHIEYVSQLIPDKLLFSGKLSDDRDVCIKFTRHYSPEAHSFCSLAGYAPELLGFQPIAGGWVMVVMDLIGFNYVEFHKSSRAGNPATFETLRDILSRLHEAGFVHGDIRDTNIMVDESSGGCPMLVDFDWAGKIGDVRYPMNVYRGPGLWRPDGACDGELITVDHDIQMLERLHVENHCNLIVLFISAKVVT
ncbi:hypothetical protein BJV78DRAFT_1350597 [Lactifluus subvellereus]|nr:hypothetical protein BJV78DRAFT_1350597 [Lactifluus subvellereus]